jgi:hypothetical protein
VSFIALIGGEIALNREEIGVGCAASVRRRRDEDGSARSGGRLGTTL